MNDFKKQCAEALGWRQHGQSFHVPDGTLDKFHENLYMRISDMHFHDSYDWSWLLLNKVEDEDKYLEFKYELHKVIHPELELWSASPEQISQACLEVLR